MESYDICLSLTNFTFPMTYFITGSLYFLIPSPFQHSTHSSTQRPPSFRQPSVNLGFISFGFLFCFIDLFFNLHPSQLAYSATTISGLESSDSSPLYNTQCPSQQVSSLMPPARLAHPPSHSPSSNPVCSLYLRVSSVLSPSLFLDYFCFPSLMFICSVS